MKSKYVVFCGSVTLRQPDPEWPSVWKVYGVEEERKRAMSTFKSAVQHAREDVVALAEVHPNVPDAPQVLAWSGPLPTGVLLTNLVLDNEAILKLVIEAKDEEEEDAVSWRMRQARVDAGEHNNG